MPIIDDFLVEYERQYDYWDASGRTVRRLIESALTSAGLRAIVTSRAKSTDRLAEKLKQREPEKRYGSVADVEQDIVDRAGVRVALYFPGQMEEAEQLIRASLDVVKVKVFPRTDGPIATDKRFSGYGARHFHVYAPAKALAGEDVRYAAALVEVQVASVLMHAWSEVEHDLVYKPLEGRLSPSELALLDQLNGLVLAGEIALQQLQKAGDERVAAASATLRDHFELAEFVRSRIAAQGREVTDTSMGRVDVLYDYLNEQGMARAADIDPYLDQLDQDFEARPVSQQLADLMLAGHPDRYSLYQQALSKSRHPSKRAEPEQSPSQVVALQAVGRFIGAWAEFEEVAARALPDLNVRSLGIILNELRSRDMVDDVEYEELDSLRQLRNKVVHDPAAVVSLSDLEVGAVRVGRFVDRLSSA